MPQILILPQQPNYTIHTSQAATINRATQTENFLEAEKRLTVMTMSTGYLVKKSAEGESKE
jgi:hypothetical protein